METQVPKGQHQHIQEQAAAYVIGWLVGNPDRLPPIGLEAVGKDGTVCVDLRIPVPASEMVAWFNSYSARGGQ